jgi:type II secretory pathway predicted ATPase ExeA
MERHRGSEADLGQPLGDDFARVAGARRRRALEQVRVALEEGHGPVLVTGEPGAGKSWLAERVAALLPSAWSVATVDLASALGAIDFLRLVADPLGVAGGGGVADARLRLRAALADDAADGRRWLLVVDEAQRGSPAVWDEVQSIVHRLGRPGGFAALLLLGQTELLRELAGRRRSGFAASVILHVHLVPLDLDEARELLGFGDGASAAVEAAVENLHRDARGNAGRMVRLIQSRPELVSATGERPRIGAGSGVAVRGTPPSFGLAVLSDPAEAPESPEDVPRPARLEQAAAAPPAGSTPLFPVKPPIRAEEGLVEVGWGGELESELEPDANTSLSAAADPARDSGVREELVEDRYAALQAWTEWTRNQARPVAGGDASSPAPEETETEDSFDSESAGVGDAAAAVGSPGSMASAGLRAEGQHEFAPYSQLFTRPRESKQPGG